MKNATATTTMPSTTTTSRGRRKSWQAQENHRTLHQPNKNKDKAGMNTSQFHLLIYEDNNSSYADIVSLPVPTITIFKKKLCRNHSFFCIYQMISPQFFLRF